MSVTAWELKGEGWVEISGLEPGDLRKAIDNRRRRVWVDIEGDHEAVTAVLAEIVEGSRALEGIDPGLAAEGGESPPESPPKAKAFRDAVFVRAYWLGIPEGSHSLAAQEVHLIAGRTFAITMRYRPVAWSLEGAELTPHPYRDGEAGLDPAHARRAFLELRGALSGEEMVFGLEVAEVILDHVVDSLFDSLNALRRRADQLEEDALGGEWLWQKKPMLENRMLGLRRLLRQVRWAFLPSDEISEVLSGPFIGVEETAKGIARRFDDLGREADRAVEASRDVTDQVQLSVDMVHTMKADRLNNTTYVLTVVATVLLLPTLIAGIYGMNFRYMPELGWRPGYWTVLVGMVVLGFGAWRLMDWYLRRR